MKAPALVAVVVALHVSAVGAFIFIQGCGTTQQAAVVEPPPPPVMPPKQSVEPVRPVPAFRPPVDVAPTPARIEQAGAKTYTIQKGDFLGKIANKCGISVRELQELNNITDPNKIRVGQKLVLPPYANAPKQAAAPARTSSSTAAPAAAPYDTSGAGTHVVVKGDTLSGIASKYGTSVSAVKASNKLKSDVIRIGQKLKVPAAGSAASTPAASKPAPAPEPAPAPAPKPVVEEPAAAPEPVAETAPAPAAEEAPVEADVVMAEPAAAAPDLDEVFPYVVMEGETLEEIARNFSVLKEDILKLNGLTDPAEIRSGMKINIPPMKDY